MAEAEINIEKVFKNMMFGKNMTECGYFPERQAENILTYFDWLDKSLPMVASGMLMKDVGISFSQSQIKNSGKRSLHVTKNAMLKI